jgi:hypothetical protein
MTPARIPRIWLNPPKYWAATKQMFPEEVERMMDRLFSLAEKGELDALRKFEFISIEEDSEDAA